MSMRKSEIFWWGVIGALFVSLLTGGVSGVKYHAKLAQGYCPSEGRILSQKQIMDDVVKEFIRGRETSLSKDSVVENTVRYSGIDEFYTLNPNCCAIALATTKNIHASFWQIRYNSRVLGNKYYVLIIKYLNTSEQEKTTQKIVDVCGKRRDIIGDGWHTGPYLNTLDHYLRPEVGEIDLQNSSEE